MIYLAVAVLFYFVSAIAIHAIKHQDKSIGQIAKDVFLGPFIS